MKFPFSAALVTGGLGFVGSHIVDGLMSLDVSVCVLDDLSTGKMLNLVQARKKGKIEVVKGSITNPATVRKIVRDVEVVFHEAAMVGVQQSVREPVRTRQVNAEGTRHLVDECVSGKVKKLIFASSAAVYGESKVLPHSETSEVTPQSPYGRSKLEGERFLTKAYEENGFDGTSLRYFNIYGPRSASKDYSGVIDSFAERLITGKPLVIYGDGKQTRDFVYVTDVVSANLLAASTSATRGRILNVGTGTQTSIETLARLETELFGRVTPLQFEYREPRHGDIKQSYADISLISELTGYSPQFPLREGLSRYLGLLYPARLKGGGTERDQTQGQLLAQEREGDGHGSINSAKYAPR